MSVFTEQTNEFFIGIKFNNNKEWFHSHKDMYKTYVHEPMAELGQNLADKLNAFDNTQVLLSRVSRANRDIRFSQNKNPYKISKWFFLRTSKSSRIVYQNPTIFFEANAEWWRYGFFYDPSPKGMAEFRKKVYANPSEAERIVDLYHSQSHFQIDGELYKRVFNKDISDKANELAQRKWIQFTRYEDYDNLNFYSDNLCDIVYEKLIKIYPIYQYFNNANNVIL